MRYIVGIAVVVLLLFLAIIWIVNRGGGEPGQAVDLSQYADREARVEFTQYGSVVGQDERRAIRISVSRSERVLEVLAGYEERIERREVFSNIGPAYAEFVMALHRAGFALEKDAPEDPRGFCPQGYRYAYKLFSNSAEIFNHWSTSCTREHGSFNGNAPTVRRLFQQQIPEYGQRTRDVRLR